MALDTMQKRGSAIGVSLPWRNWVAAPSGWLTASERMSIGKLCTANLPTPTGFVPCPVKVYDGAAWNIHGVKYCWPIFGWGSGYRKTRVYAG